MVLLCKFLVEKFLPSLPTLSISNLNPIQSQKLQLKVLIIVTSEDEQKNLSLEFYITIANKFIFNIRLMSHHRNCQHNGRKNSNSRHGDWICPFCNNYNYSFRVICNRCSAHPNSNPYMSNYFPYPCAQSIDKYPQKQDIKPTENKDNGFPKFLFLMLGDENLQWKQPQHSFAVENRGEQLANRWIQKLIQD